MTTPRAPRRRRAPRSCAALVVAAVALTGCGDDDTATTPATSTSASETSSASGQPSTTPSAPSTTRTPTPPTTSPTPGTAIAGEALSASQVDELQRAVDQGQQPWRLDVAAVAEAVTRGELGWTDAQVALADPHTAEVTSGTDGRMVTLQLRQPAREGADGIWLVVSGVWLN